MLTYSLDSIGKDSLYEYIYKMVKSDIINGTLPHGTKLPSKRGFAENLGVSTITVENAYAQLLAEGYIYSMPRRGYFVSDIAGLASCQTLSRQKYYTVTEKEKYIADFTSNRMLTSNFPFSTWAKTMRRAISENSTELMSPSPGQGILPLRQAIADILLQFRGIDVSPEQIIVGAGTEYLYGLIIQLLGYDKIYAVEDPGYKKVYQIFESHGVSCRHIPLDDSGISIPALENSKVDIVHISPSHHFPTGIVTSAARRYELLNWAAGKNRYIIEDDYDSEFRFVGRPIPSLQSIDHLDKVIYMNTFSKSLTPTIRISYMVLPFGLMERFQEKLGFYACTVSSFEQYTLAHFINDGYFEKHINRTRNFYRKMRDTILYDIMNSPLAPYTSISQENSGLHFLLHVNTTISDKELTEKALKQGIKLSCLSQYYFEPAAKSEHVLIVNYSNIVPSDISEITHRMCLCLIPNENHTDTPGKLKNTHK